MVFLYSRKLQIMLLLLWFTGMTFMYVQTTGERPLWLARADERIAERSQKALLGREPVLSALPEPVLSGLPEPAPPESAVPDPRPAADPKLNRCLAMRVEQGAGGREDTLIFELDYVAAQAKGFSAEKAHGYYLEDAPAYVVAFGEPWVSDIGNVSIPGEMPHVSGLDLIVSRSRNLRLLVHTRSMRAAREARLRIEPTATGVRAEILLPR